MFGDITIRFESRNDTSAVLGLLDPYALKTVAKFIEERNYLPYPTSMMYELVRYLGEMKVDEGDLGVEGATTQYGNWTYNISKENWHCEYLNEQTYNNTDILHTAELIQFLNEAYDGKYDCALDKVRTR